MGCFSEAFLEVALCLQRVDFEFAGEVQTPLSAVFSFMSSENPKCMHFKSVIC